MVRFTILKLHQVSKSFIIKCKNIEIRKKLSKILDPSDILESQKEVFHEDGFGLTDFVSDKPGNLANQNLIKRYNYYSMRVLNSMEETTKLLQADPKLRRTKIDQGPAAKKVNSSYSVIICKPKCKRAFIYWSQ